MTRQRARIARIEAKRPATSPRVTVREVAPSEAQLDAIAELLADLLDRAAATRGP